MGGWPFGRRHLQRLPGPGEVRALVAPAGPFAAATAIEALRAAGLARCLTGIEAVDSLIDVGRIDPGAPTISLIRSVERFVLVVRPSLESVLHTRDLLASLRSVGCRASALVIGDRPYSPTDVAEAVGADELLGVLPDDPVGAMALAGDARSPKVLARTRLVRAAADLARFMVPPPELPDAPVALPPPPPDELRTRPFGLSSEATR